jgi:predicted helicase
VSNNSFVDQFAFDGMRKHLMRDFTLIYHLHLEGNVRHNPHLSGTAYNVFGIQVGVGITIAARSRGHDERRLYFHRIDKNLRREEKYQWLAAHGSTNGVEWEALSPDQRHTWLVSEHGDEFARMIPIGSKEAKAAELRVEAVFKSYCRGIATNADAYVYDYDRERLDERAQRIVDDFNAQLDRWRRNGQARALGQAMIDVPHDPALEQRASVWQNAGIGLLDALHLASAEAGGADVFVTADDLLLQRAARVTTTLRVVGLLDFLREIAP